MVFCLGVLAQVALPCLPVEVEDDLRGAEGVELGPVGEVLGGVVWAVVASPPGVACEVAALVEVAVVELLGGGRLHVDQQALQQCPSRRRHGGIDDYIGVAGVQVH